MKSLVPATATSKAVSIGDLIDFMSAASLDESQEDDLFEFEGFAGKGQPDQEFPPDLGLLDFADLKERLDKALL